MAQNFFKVRNGVNVGVLSADPSGGTEGDMYYNSTLLKLREYKNGAWRSAVDEDSTQTLTNKTLTSPVINSPTGITKTDVGLGNVDNTSDATKNAAVATLTNKTLTSPVINSPTGIVKGDVGLGNVDNTSDATKNSATATLSNKQVQFSVSTDSTVTGSNATASAFTSGVVRLTNASLVSLSGIPAGSAGQFLILENKTGNQISINNEEATATAANRIQTGNSSNVSMPNNATFAFTYDITSSRWQLTGGSGSGSGSGSGKNYLSAIVTSQSSTPNTGNGNFEAGSTLGWSLGTVGTLTNGIPTGSPTFGSGASGNLSISVVSSGQLAGSYSLSYVSSAVTTQGNMLASDAFNIDNEDQAKVLTWKFYYKAQTNPGNANWSGTSSNSFGVAVYDVTNSSWLTSTANFGMTQSSGIGIATGTCQTNATTTQLRLVMYNVNATSGAVTVYFDDFSVGPETSPIGTVTTDWIPYTPTWTGLGTNTNNLAFYRRVGDSIEIMARTTSGTSAASTCSFSLPNGLAIDTSKTSATVNFVVGFGVVTTTTPLAINVITIPATSTTLLYPTRSTIAANGSSLVGNSEIIEVNVKVPIVGWSSNVQMSSDTDTRVISFYGNQTSQAATAGVTDIAYTAIQDKAGAWNGTQFKVPIAGDYVVAVSEIVNTASTLDIYKNGAHFAYMATGWQANAVSSGSVLIPGCIPGDLISVRVTVSATVTSGSLSIFRLSGPAVVQATESVNARYTNAAGTGFANSGADLNVPFATKDYDSHNAWNGTQYVVPVSGKYRISATVNTAGATWTAGNPMYLSVYKNGSAHSYGPIWVAFANISVNPGVPIIAAINCNAGDTLEIRLAQNRTGGTINLVASSSNNHVEIERVGN